MSRDFVFGIDLDGVCADFFGGIRLLAAEWLGVEESTLPRQFSYALAEWGFDRAPGGYLAFHRWAVTQRDLFRILRPMPGCPQALRSLSQLGVRIRIITHRLAIKHFHREAIVQTTEWLDHHGIPYWDLCFLRDKADLGADIYIDDYEENVRRFREAGRECIIFTSPTNLGMDGLRAENWQEAERIVRERWERVTKG